jgi:hypothetical protein
MAARPESGAAEAASVSTVLYILGALALAIGFAGVVLPALPGSLLLVLGVFLLAWAGNFAVLGWPTVIAAAVIGIAIGAVDYAAGMLGAKAFGASRWAVIGSVAGLVVGLFLGLPGILLGPAVGAVALEYLKDPDFAKAARAGTGVLVGFVVGSILKVALAVVLLGLVALAFLR